MANIRQVFDALVDGGTSGRIIKISDIGSFNQYETIRTRLCTFWAEHREILLAFGDENSDPMCKLSLCGTYHQDALAATFFLGKSRRRPAREFSFEIVDPHASETSEKMMKTTLAETFTPPTPSTTAVNDDASLSILAQIS